MSITVTSPPPHPTGPTHLYHLIPHSSILWSLSLLHTAYANSLFHLTNFMNYKRLAFPNLQPTPLLYLTSGNKSQYFVVGFMFVY